MKSKTKRSDMRGVARRHMSRESQQQVQKDLFLQASDVKTHEERFKKFDVIRFSKKKIKLEYPSAYVQELWEQAQRGMLPETPTGIG